MKDLMMNLGIESVRQAVMVLVLVLVLVMLLTGCSNGLFGGKTEKPLEQPLEITEFTYSVSGMSDSFTATFAPAGNGGTHVTAEAGYGSYTMDEVLEEDYMTRLGQLAAQYRMDKWDGFDKADKRVLDGEQFELHITLADGKTIRASGSNAYPKNFHEPMSEVRALIDQLIRTYSNMYPKQILSEDICYFSLVFRNAPYATSEFKVICSDYGEEKELEMRIRGREDLMDGEYEFSGACRDFPFDEVQKIIRKYDIPSWNGWEKTEGDKELFNLELHYESGEILEAYGTVHPENYDAFRDDITALLMDYITENKDLLTPYSAE